MGVQIPHGKGRFEGEGGILLWSIGTLCGRLCKNGSDGPRNHVLDGVQIPHGKGEFWGKEVPIVKYRDLLSWAVQKTAEMIDLPFGLRTWVGRRKHKFSHICKVTPMCPHGRLIGATWQIWLNRLSAAAMRPYVKLLWPLVSMLSITVCLCGNQGVWFLSYSFLPLTSH